MTFDKFMFVVISCRGPTYWWFQGSKSWGDWSPWLLRLWCVVCMCSDQLDVFPVLSNLTTVRRFATMVMFLSSKDKQGCTSVELFWFQVFNRVPTPPGKYWIFYWKFQDLESSGKSLWSWKVLEIKA